MDAGLFLKAVGLGFGIAAIVGPISLLTMRRTLTHGRLYGLATGAGVALADATYAAVAALGLTALAGLLIGWRRPLGIAGGLLIAYLGIRTLLARPPAEAAVKDRAGLGYALVSIYGLTITNPMTIVSFAALFGAIGLTRGRPLDAIAVTAGVFLGSAAWWVVLTSAAGALRNRVAPAALVWINRVLGTGLLVFGAAAVVRSASA